jgi:hypothetical protein
LFRGFALARFDEFCADARIRRRSLALGCAARAVSASFEQSMNALVGLNHQRVPARGRLALRRSLSSLAEQSAGAGKK